MKAYFVDTNILIDIKRIITGEINPNRSRYHRNYNDLIELITSDEIEILVVPTVLEEIRRGSHKDDALTERFIGRFCTQCELTEQEQLWADDLYDEYIAGEEDAVIPVFKDMGKMMKYNTKDAHILAEVTAIYNGKRYDAVKFITNNIIDFINVDGVRRINQDLGLKTITFNSIAASNVKKEIR